MSRVFFRSKCTHLTYWVLCNDGLFHCLFHLWGCWLTERPYVILSVLFLLLHDLPRSVFTPGAFFFLFFSITISLTPCWYSLFACLSCLSPILLPAPSAPFYNCGNETSSALQAGEQKEKCLTQPYLWAVFVCHIPHWNTHADGSRRRHGVSHTTCPASKCSVEVPRLIPVFISTVFFSDSLLPPIHCRGPVKNVSLSVVTVHLFLLSSAPAVMRTHAQTSKDPSFE